MRYGITLNEPERFFKQAKLRAFFTDEAFTVKACMGELMGLMHDKEDQPTKFVSVLKEMLNENTCKSELCKEICGCKTN